MTLARKVVDAVTKVCGPGPKQLHKPEIGSLERAHIAEAVASGWVADGPYIERFEALLCKITGAQHAVAVSSGTAALHLAMVAGGLYAGRTVSMPSLTFVATANAIAYTGATPVFSEGVTEISVDLLGHCKPGRVTIEDACQALGSEYGGQKAGMFGILGCFSFNGNKVCTAGGGGAIVTDDEIVAGYIRHLANQAKGDYRVAKGVKLDVGFHGQDWHDQVGWNYRMSNLTAALGLAQLERLEEFLARKRKLAQRYLDAFAAIPGVEPWVEPEQGRSNYWLNAIKVPDRQTRIDTVHALIEAGYESRALQTPVHLLPMYAECPKGDMAKSMLLWDRTICLPSGYDVA